MSLCIIPVFPDVTIIMNKVKYFEYFVFPHSRLLWLYHILTFMKYRKTQVYKSEHIFMKRAD